MKPSSRIKGAFWPVILALAALAATAIICGAVYLASQDNLFCDNYGEEVNGVWMNPDC